MIEKLTLHSNKGAVGMDKVLITLYGGFVLGTDMNTIVRNKVQIVVWPRESTRRRSHRGLQHYLLLRGF